MVSAVSNSMIRNTSFVNQNNVNSKVKEEANESSVEKAKEAQGQSTNVKTNRLQQNKIDTYV